jgi:hypothetical protein
MEEPQEGEEVMVVHEIRDSISSKDSFDVGEDPVIFQRKITLQGAQRHTVNFIDFFDDSVLVPQNNPFAYEFFVSKFPIAPTAMRFAEFFPLGGPEAADNNILFKAVGVAHTPSLFQKAEFPNQFLGSSPTFTFYTPHLYLTLMLHGENSSPETIIDPRMSVYMAVESEDVDDVEFTMGAFREWKEAQFTLLMNNGVIVPNNTAGQAGETFPSWLFGGMRPERMMRSDALAEFWMTMSSTTAETMNTWANLGIFIDSSRVMQPFDVAFGSQDTLKGGVPDWLRFGIIGGVSSGPIRPEFPPNVYADNGNTRMV